MIKENKYRIKSFQQLYKELIQSQPASIKSFKKHWAEHGKKLPKFLYRDEELAKLYQQQQQQQQQNLKTTGLHQAKVKPNCGPYQAKYEKYVCSTSI